MFRQLTIALWLHSSSEAYKASTWSCARAYAAKSASTRKGSPSLSKRLTTALASSGRPHAGRGNLLGQIRRRHDSLRKRDIVIRQEHDTQLVMHGGVRIDGARHVVVEFDDGLGHGITRSRLAGKDQ